MRRENETCPVCLNKCGHHSRDGDVWNCDHCRGYHDFEQRIPVQ